MSEAEEKVILDQAGVRFRPRSDEIVYQKVWASLCERMAPETHLVRPQWKKMMREIGTSRQAIAVAVNNLKAEGKIESVDEKVRKGNRDWIVIHYRVKV